MKFEMFLKGFVILMLMCASPAVLVGQSEAEKQALVKQARAYVDSLTSERFGGRGYQDEGHRIAARYIARHFRDYGLEPAAGTSDTDPYFQPFRLTLNLVDSLELELNGKQLVEGRDFIAASSSGKNRRMEEPMRVIDLKYGMPNDFEKDLSNCLVLIREGMPPKFKKKPALKDRYQQFANEQAKVNFATKLNASGVIFVKKKLTAGLSGRTYDIPVVAVQADRLEALKLKAKKIKRGKLFVKSKLRPIQTQNVAGMVRGSVYPDSVVIICAHYDHLGKQGQAIFWGGNDNASGTSMLLSMANHYGKPENRPAYSILFIAFGAEETGLRGSLHYVDKEPLVPLEKTVFVMNLDLMGNGDKGITAVAGADFKSLFQLLTSINDSLELVPVVKARRNAPNSDHYFFINRGVKGMFIYTLGGPPHYHDINDTGANLLFSRYAEVRRLIMLFLETAYLKREG